MEKDPELAHNGVRGEKTVVTFTRRRWFRWRTVFLLSLLVTLAALLVLAVGLAAGLGVARDERNGRDAIVMNGDLMDNNVVVMALDDPNCPVHPVPSSLPSPLPAVIQTALSAVENQLAKLVDSNTQPGLVVSITYRDQEIWSKGFGVTSKQPTAATPDTNTIFRIASVSKVFTAFMVYQLYEHGLVQSLDDPLNMFCPDFHIDNPFTGDNITLRQIMSYMSGLPREAPCGVVTLSELQASATVCPHNTSVILSRLRSQSLILPPWTEPSYSNLGFGLLGRCLVPHFYPGTSYEEYIEENILQPLGMTSTGFNYTESVMKRLAVGYLPNGDPEPVYDIGWWAPAAQMYSTLQDLNKFSRFFYSIGGIHSAEEPVSPDVLSPTLRRLMILPTYTNRDQRTGMGTPWEIRFQNNYTINMKGGNLQSYSTLFSFVPDLHLGLNIAFSGAADEFSVGQKAYDMLIPAFVEVLTSPRTYPLPPNVTVYTGFYTGVHDGGGNVSVMIYLNSLVLVGDGAAGGVYLAYRAPFRFQVELPEGSLPCLSSELLALAHSWVHFDEPVDSSELASGFTLPGTGSFSVIQYLRK